MPKLPMSASKLVKLLLLSWMFVLVPAPAMAADQKSGFGLGFEKMQKIWQGISNAPKMTTCRLANKTVYKGKQICVYKGANKTILGVYNMAGIFVQPPWIAAMIQAAPRQLQVLLRLLRMPRTSKSSKLMVLIVWLLMLVSVRLAIRLLAGGERRLKIGDQVRGRFQPDVEAHKTSTKVLSWPINI